jgi:multidrug efflux pump subunit AcrA (membrane-fusion protein)
MEKARLEASKQSIVSVIQGEESKVDLATAQEKVSMEQATVDLHKRSDAAKIASLRSQRDKAQAEVDLTRHRLEQMTVRTPSSGVVTYLMNRSQGWINQQPFKVGDHAWPGGAIAEIPDPDTLQMEGKLDEVDRGRVDVGEEVQIHVDSLPEKTFDGKLTSISALTEIDFGEEWPPTRNFKAYGRLAHPDEHLRPAMNGNMDVIVRRIKDATSIPAKALFTHGGHPLVYVKAGDHYRAIAVEVTARNPDEVAVTGLPNNAQVATVEPRPDQLGSGGGGQ